jgi:MFS transporter, DHA1 family, multidrug resistance protein
MSAMNAPLKAGDASAPALKIGKIEFIAMMAALMAINALAIDVMLPGMQEIGASLGEPDENRRQLVITAYLLGFSVMQLAFGPLSDRFGRRMPLAAGVAVYVLAATGAVFVPAFAPLLGLRFIQGMGAAATRVITVAIVRDVFGGRQMAEVMSLIMTVFMVMPVVAPSIGQGVMLFGEWHLIFVFMAVAAAGILAWMWLRLPETLHPQYRRPFTLASVATGFKVVMTNRLSLWYTLAMSAILGALFGFINSAQQVYVGIYGLGVWFPVAFACVAGLMSAASFMNSRLVVRLGMRRLSHAALIGFITASVTLAAYAAFGPVPFPIFITLFALAMIFFGMIGSNFGAIAMEPLGALAGTASSVQGFMQTVVGAVAGGLIGQAFDGTVLPLTLGFATVGLLALVFVLIAEKGVLFGSGTTARH